MWDEQSEREHSQRAAGDRAPELLVLLALSGGGTRAAALGYGVMQELAATRVVSSRGRVPLLDEVDIISSVSGGSFLSAYFGLYGDRVFEDFEQRFLRRPIEDDLWKGLFAPVNWQALWSSAYGRSDMAANYYDEHIFDGKTFADTNRPGAPLVIINTTDIATGQRLTFMPMIFDLICADLESYPISRAVAASSAVPGAATPIALQNRAGQCGYTVPVWLQDATAGALTSVGKVEARGVTAYLDAEQHPWIHLVDGGISDNLGLRAFYSILSLERHPRLILQKYGHENVRRILIVSVNAETDRYPEWSRGPDAPLMVEVLRSAAQIQMERYGADTISLVRSSYEHLVDTLAGDGQAVDFDFVEVNIAAVSDPEQRKMLNQIETSLQLDDEAIDQLIAAGRQLLRDSPDFRRFVAKSQPQGQPALNTGL